MAIFARVTRFEDQPKGVDAAIDQFRRELGPAARKLPGFMRAYLFVDRETGRGMAITLWDSEEARAAGEELATELRGDATRAQAREGLTVWGVERYEVAVVQ